MFKPVPNGLVLFLTGLNIDNFRTFVNVQRDHKMNIPRTLMFNDNTKRTFGEHSPWLVMFKPIWKCTSPVECLLNVFYHTWNKQNQIHGSSNNLAKH